MLDLFIYAAVHAGSSQTLNKSTACRKLIKNTDLEKMDTHSKFIFNQHFYMYRDYSIPVSV